MKKGRCFLAGVVYKTDAQIDQMKRAGALAYELLELAEQTVRPGISTKELNDIIHQHTLSRGGRSAPLGYRGFPEACCTSVNEVVCHGIPSSHHILQEGDIINVDVTPIVEEFHGDTSRTFFVGGEKCASPVARKLVHCARECLQLGIEQVVEGGTVLDVARAISQRAHDDGFSVVQDFVGHGIGRVFHEPPHVQHCVDLASKQKPVPLCAGMTFTIEPMINEGSAHAKVLSDGWTAVTWDGKLSAQFEHTLGLRSDGTLEILTLP